MQLLFISHRKLHATQRIERETLKYMQQDHMILEHYQKSVTSTELFAWNKNTTASNYGFKLLLRTNNYNGWLIMCYKLICASCDKKDSTHVVEEF